MAKLAIKNDIIKNLNTTIKNKNITVSLFNPIGMGYDGCGTHTHGYASSSRINSQLNKINKK